MSQKIMKKRRLRIMIEVGDFTQQDYFAPKGWVCPKCGRVYAPSTPMCWYCGKEEIRNVPNTTGSPVNFDEYIRKISVSIDDTPPITYNSFGDWMINQIGE